MKKTKKVLLILVLVVISFIGGIIGREFILPKIVGIWPMSKIDWKLGGNVTTIVNKTEEFNIVEDEGFAKVADRLGQQIVLIESFGADDEIIGYGSGVAMTADGLILANSVIVSKKAVRYSVVINGEVLAAEIKTVSENGLVLMTVNKNNLPVVSFADKASLKIGERLMLLGVERDKETNEVSKFANMTFIRKNAGNTIIIDRIVDEAVANGAPIIDIEGRVVGVAEVDKNGNVSVISFAEIEKFLDGFMK